MNYIIYEIKRLKFENILWIIFIILSIANIVGDIDEEKFIKTNNKIYKYNANKIFKFTLIVTLIIYIYFFIRNYESYKNISYSKKKLYSIKLLGSSLLIAGIICLIYFKNIKNNIISFKNIFLMIKL